LIGLGVISAVIIAALLTALLKGLFARPTFHPHWEPDAHSTSQPEKIAINYELHFDRNLAKARSAFNPPQLVITPRRRNA